MLQELIKLYEVAESTGIWPEALRHGIIRSLAKVDDALSASQTRPIQVLSITYRVYTSIRTKQILPLLAPRLHPAITGMKGKGPDAIAWTTHQLIETALIDGSSLVGTILDLTKAFDHLPRLPLWRHGLRLGIPPAVIRAWAGAVIGHQRHFQVGLTTGPGQATTKGFPQGCALSCVAMVLLNDLVGLTLHNQGQPYHFTAYADNWQLIAANVPDLSTQVDQVAQFCHRFQLPMDANKTETWGVRKPDQDQLRAGGARLVTNTRDLGYIMTYDNKHHTKLQKRRLQQMEQDWFALRYCQASLTPKLIGIEVVLWRRFFHAIETSRIAPADYQTLRAKAARALGFGNPGASAWATLNLVLPRNVDPTWFALRHTIRMARKWFWALPPCQDLWHHWLRHAARASGDGPMQSLLQMFNIISWGLHDDGTAKMENGQWLSWLQVGNKELNYHLHRAWMHVTATHMYHRQGLTRLSDPDPKETQKNYQRLGPVATSLLRRAANGTFFSKDITAHWTEDKQCPCCGADDSPWHRLDQCPATQDVKAQHWAPDEWEDLPRQLAQYGIAEVPTEVRAWHEFLHDSQQEHDVTQAIPPLTEHSEVFTDGAGYLPRDAWLKMGAWAAVLATPTGFHTLAAHRLTGILQGSDRAETYAILWTCQWASTHRHTVSIWTDYAPAISTWQAVTQTSRVTPDIPHADLWQGILTYILQGTLITLHKVHSHQEPPTDPGDYWAWQGNHAADRQAGYALEEWLPDEEALYLPAAIRATQTRNQTRRAQEYLVKAANAFTKAKPDQHPEDLPSKRQKTTRGLEHAKHHAAQGHKRPREERDDALAPQTYDYNTGKWTPQVPVHTHLQLTSSQADKWAAAIGHDMAKHLWQWVCAWCDPATPPIWISWQQLALLYHGCMQAPVLLPPTPRLRACGRPKTCGRAEPWWGEQAVQLRLAFKPMLSEWPWIAKAASLRPSAAIRIFCTCIPMRIPASLVHQLDQVCLLALPAGAVSTTAYRCVLPTEQLRVHVWPRPATDWPGTQRCLN